MEKLCKIRDIQRSVVAFETMFEKCYGISLNEGMALCSLYKLGNLSSGEIGEALGLTSSNTSKVIASIERKGYVERILGTKDKRQMYFSLSGEGEKLISSIKCDELTIPELLESIVSI